MVDFPVPVDAIGTLRIPKKFNPRNPQQRRELAQVLRNRTDLITDDLPPSVRSRPARGPSRRRPGLDRRPPELRAHPCHGCSDREDHARGQSELRLARDTRRAAQDRAADQHHRPSVRPGLPGAGRPSVPRRRRGPPDRRPAVADLRRLDLVAAECLRQGLFDGLSLPELAACLAALVFEVRRADKPSSPGCRVAGERSCGSSRCGGTSSALEREHRWTSSARVDWPSLAGVPLGLGRDLAEVLYKTDLAAGDFVRWMKQLSTSPTRSPTRPVAASSAPPPGRSTTPSAAG